MNRSRLAPALLCAVLVAGTAVGACSTTSGGTPVTLSTTTTAGAADPGPTTSTTAEPDASEGKELFVYAPEEGDCIDLRATGDQGATTTRALPDPNATPHGSKELILRLDCDLPHQYEVIAVVGAGLPGTPDEAALIAAAKQLCPAAFAAYVGTPYQDSSLEVGWVLPSEEQRARRVQQIGCLAFDPTGKLVGSVRGSAR
jgi:hypothetical protein